MIRKRTRTLGMVGVLLLGVIGATAFSTAALTVSDAPPDSDGLSNVQVDGEEATEPISIVEALEAAENGTNGTAVGAERQGNFSILEGNASPSEEASLQYNVDVLLDNGTHLEVAIYAVNGSVAEAAEAEEGFLAGIFGEDEIPDKPLNLSAMRSASDAVELVQNETEENGTVTAVNLNERDDLEERNETLVYEGQVERGEDEQVTVIVAAFEAEGSVITVEGAEGNATGETPGEDNSSNRLDSHL